MSHAFKPLLRPGVAVVLALIVSVATVGGALADRHDEDDRDGTGLLVAFGSPGIAVNPSFLGNSTNVPTDSFRHGS